MSKHDKILIIFGIFVFLLGLLTARIARADQPVWCSVDYFKSHEVKTNAPNTKRLRAFQVGKLYLAGAAIGGSDAVEVASLSKAPASAKHCTWYLNKGNKEAEKIFHHEYMRGPYWGWLDFLFNVTGVVKSYEKRLENHWEPMVSCAESYGYLAMGCDGHRHRGPSVFASFLSLSGCVPDTATDIANYLWRLNGVPDFTREKIAKIGWKLGNEKPELRKRLQEVMSAK